MNETDWVPGLAVLAVAVVVGVALALRSRGGATLPSPTETRRAELLRQKESAFALLREHDGIRESADPGTWHAEKKRLEREAADILRALDELGGAAGAPGATAASAGAATPATSAPSTAAAVRGAQLRGALWGAGAVLLLGGLFWFVQKDATVRGEGGSMTGNQQSESGGMGGGTTPQPELTPEQEKEIAALRAEVAANPTDLPAKNRLAHALLEANALMDAFQVSEEVVKADSENAEARTHQAMVLIGIGDMAIAEKVLDRVLAASPDFPEALLWRGMVHLQNGQREQAAATWERAAKADPSMATGLAPLIEKAKQPAQPGEGGPFGTTKHPPVTGLDPGATGGGSATGGAADPADVTGEIRGDGVKPGETLFVMAKPEGQTGGAPTWVQRIPVESLPMAFRIGPSNAMMGGPAPEKLVLTARVDRDGNMKASSGDLEGKSGTVAPGTTGVNIELAPVP